MPLAAAIASAIPALLSGADAHGPAQTPFRPFCLFFDTIKYETKKTNYQSMVHEDPQKRAKSPAALRNRFQPIDGNTGLATCSQSQPFFGRLSMWAVLPG